MLLALAFAVRRAPWPAHGPNSVLLYAEDEGGTKLGHAAVEVCGLHRGEKCRLAEAVQRPLLTALFVEPKYRRRGVARELMYAAEAQAANWGFEELVLNVQRSNEAAQGLYSKSGYMPDAEPEISCSSADGSWWGRWWHGQKYVLLRKPLDRRASSDEGNTVEGSTSATPTVIEPLQT